MPDVIHRPVQENELRNILLDKLEAPVAAQVRDVIHPPGHEIVNADDLVTARQQQVNQMRPEEPGGAGDNRHGRRGRRFGFFGHRQLIGK